MLSLLKHLKNVIFYNLFN